MKKVLEVRKLKTRINHTAIGGIPVKKGKEYLIIYPLFNNLEECTDENNSFSLRKIYKNKFILHKEFYIENSYELKKYYEYFEDLIIDVNRVYETKIRNILYENNVSSILNKEEVKELMKIYDFKKVTTLINTIFNEGIKMFHQELEDEDSDYDLDECIMISFDKLLEKLSKNINNNIENIYILESLMYYDFKDLYLYLYNYSK